MTLPQDHPWQTTLRDWIAAKGESDFALTLADVGFDESWVASDDDLYRLWLTLENFGRQVIDTTGLQVAPAHFTLAGIEREDGIYGWTRPFFQIGEMTWLYQWSYPGNPHHQSENLANRIFSYAFLQAIMVHDTYVSPTHAMLSQYASATLAINAYVYTHLSHLLPEATREAFKESIKLLFEGIEAAGPTGIQSNMDHPAMIGMYYAGRFLGEDYASRAESYAREFFNSFYRLAGYLTHGGALDTSYIGISIYYLTWLANETRWQFTLNALEGIHRLKQHHTFPEFGRGELKDATAFYGPSSFSTSTALGFPTDQYWSYKRDVAASYVSPAAAYLRYTGRSIALWWRPYGIKPASDMLTEIEGNIARMNNPAIDTNLPKWTVHIDREPTMWRVDSHQHTPHLAWDYYPEGFYERALAEAESAPAFMQEGDFIESFDDEYVAFKKGGFGGLLHIGQTSSWILKDGINVPGISGGSLAAFWTEKSGIAILGRMSGYAGAMPDTWHNVDTWAANHIWGISGNDFYTSGRYRDPMRNVVIDHDNAMVKVAGYMVGFDGQVENETASRYERIFDISADGLQVTAGVDMIEGFSTLWETLPLWLGGHYQRSPNMEDDEYPPIQILSGGLWMTPDPMIAYDAEAVKIERNSHIVLIDFEEAHSIHLGDIWFTTYQADRERITALHIDISETGSVRYTISGPYVHKLKKV